MCPVVIPVPNFRFRSDNRACLLEATLRRPRQRGQRTFRSEGVPQSEKAEGYQALRRANGEMAAGYQAWRCNQWGDGSGDKTRWRHMGVLSFCGVI